jgi:hypothetical protein
MLLKTQVESKNTGCLHLNYRRKMGNRRKMRNCRKMKKSRDTENIAAGNILDDVNVSYDLKTTTNNQETCRHKLHKKINRKLFQATKTTT